MQKRYPLLGALCCVGIAVQAWGDQSTQFDLKYFPSSFQNDTSFVGGVPDRHISSGFPVWTFSVSHSFNENWGGLFSYSTGESNDSSGTGGLVQRGDYDLQINYGVGRNRDESRLTYGLGRRTVKYEQDVTNLFGPGTTTIRPEYGGFYLAISGSTPLSDNREWHGYGVANYIPNLAGNEDLDDYKGHGYVFEAGVTKSLGGSDSPYFARAGYRVQKFDMDEQVKGTTPGRWTDSFKGIMVGVGTTFH